MIDKWCGDNCKFSTMTTFEHHPRKIAASKKKEKKKVQKLEDCFAMM